MHSNGAPLLHRSALHWAGLAAVHEAPGGGAGPGGDGDGGGGGDGGAGAGPGGGIGGDGGGAGGEGPTLAQFSKKFSPTWVKPPNGLKSDDAQPSNGFGL